MFWSLLQVLFIGLKLANIITWSWWWVLSPTLFWTAWAVFWLMILGGIALIKRL